MIDIEKFICSLLEDHPEGVDVRSDIHKALKDQGLEYKDGKIVPIEQKPVDKVEPKFKKGEWLCENEPNNYARFIQILETVNVQGKERYRISRDIHNDEDIVEFDFVEKYYRKFDIKDAKDGDVLYCKNDGIEYIVMSKGVNKHGNIDSYFRYNSLNGFGVDVPSVFSATHDDITPATKEQRDLLFQKMKEAGYEWDAEKKDLTKIEQKPAAWSEEDEKIYNRICDIIHSAAFSNCDVDEDGKECGEYAKIIGWFKSLKNRVGCEANCTTRWNPSEFLKS